MRLCATHNAGPPSHGAAGKLRPEISGSSPGASPRFLHRRPRSRKQPSATYVGLMTGSPLCLRHVEMPLDGFFYSSGTLLARILGSLFAVSRHGEFLILNRNGLLHLFDLNCEACVGTCDGPAERSLHATFIVIVGIVYLCGITTEWRFYIAQDAHQQPGLLVKIKLYWRSIVAYSRDNVSLISADLFLLLHMQLFEHLNQSTGEKQLRVQSGCIRF